MIICVAGDIHGQINQLYTNVLAFESWLGVEFDWVLHVGDFGIWPDANKIDKATKKHDGAGDFPIWLAENKTAIKKTLFIKGNHEDFIWLDSQKNIEILPNLFYLRNGHIFKLEDDTIIGGIGGCYSPKNYKRKSNQLQGYAKRHYTHDEIDLLTNNGPIDLYLSHDAPTGVSFDRRGENFISIAEGLAKPIDELWPSYCFFGHHHKRVRTEILGTPCIGLNKIGRAGNLVALNTNTWELLGEWPN